VALLIWIFRASNGMRGGISKAVFLGLCRTAAENLAFTAATASVPHGRQVITMAI
jgi:hypothetical protein